jgi:hypothetical protein
LIRDLDECIRDLIAGVFRLAFCDYVGLAYSHDEPGPVKYIQINRELQLGAERFLTSPWAAHLGDQAGLTAKEVWRRAQLELVRRPAMPAKPEKTRPRLHIATSEVVARRPQEDEIAA